MRFGKSIRRNTSSNGKTRRYLPLSGTTNPHCLSFPHDSIAAAGGGR